MVWSVRSTNLIERSFEEEEKQSDSPLKLVYGVLIGASARWRRVRIGENEKYQLRFIRESLGMAEKEEVHA